MPAGVLLSLVVWWYAFRWVNQWTYPSQGSYAWALGFTYPIFLLCLFVLLTVFGSIYPPALDRYLGWFDRRGNIVVVWIVVAVPFILFVLLRMLVT